jgi:hypothetical protein
MRCCFRLMVVLAISCGTLCILSSASAEEKQAPKPQYRLGDIVIPGAHADEPMRSDVSTELANDYLEHRAERLIRFLGELAVVDVTIPLRQSQCSVGRLRGEDTSKLAVTRTFFRLA